MHFDLLLLLASAAILLSPIVIDTWKYRELRPPRK